MDKQKFQYEGMKWLMELELLNHPQAINQIKFNILMTSKQIKEVELLIYREHKSMLVLLDLTWIGRKFYKKRIFTEVQEILTQLLPSFRFRVTDDTKIMNLAIESVKKALTGGNLSETNSAAISAIRPAESSPDVPTVAAGDDTVGSADNSSPSPEEPSKATETIRTDTISDDSKKQ